MAKFLEFLNDGEKCKFHNNSVNLHYSNCIYCILDGNCWEEEWDSWGEVAYRAGKIVKYGFDDYMRGIVEQYPEDSDEEVNTFRKLYNMGQNMAESSNN